MSQAAQKIGQDFKHEKGMILPTTLKFISSSLILRELNVKNTWREKKEKKSTKRIIREVLETIPYARLEYPLYWQFCSPYDLEKKEAGNY